MRDDCISGRESKVFELRSEKPQTGSRNEEVQCLCEWGLRLRARQDGNSLQRSC
jgi:hypothetical protein